MESRVLTRPPSSGRFAPREERALRPPVVSNGNVSDPASVGEDVDVAGLAGAVEITETSPHPRTIRTVLPSPWSGWPAEWDVPRWGGRHAHLVDTAWTCVDLNASLLSTMPPYTTKRGVVVDSPSWMANPDPSQYTSWEEFAKQLFWDYQLGEAFVITTARTSDGYPARFHVIEPWLVNVELDGGYRRYWVGGLEVTDDILHVRYRSSTSDARGHGPLEAGGARMVAAEVLARYLTELARGGGVPHYALTHPDELSAEQTSDLLDQWWESRLARQGQPAVLSGGVGIQTLQVNPRDMALLEISQFTESRIAVMLGVPPFLAGLPSGGDSMTYSNVSSLFDFHWRAGLRPKAQPVMAALSNWALPRGTNAEVNRDEYVRPSLTDRSSAYAALHGMEDETGRVITAAEVRRMERLDGAVAPEALTGGGQA